MAGIISSSADILNEVKRGINKMTGTIEATNAFFEKFNSLNKATEIVE